MFIICSNINQIFHRFAKLKDAKNVFCVIYTLFLAVFFKSINLKYFENTLYKKRKLIKGTVTVISCGPQCKDVNYRSLR